MNRWLVGFTVMLPTLIEILDISVVNVSLDHIRGSLSAGIDEATWSITSYLIANAIIIPITGWLSKLFGRKNYLVASITLFTMSSFCCGSAWNMPSLVFFRVLQGLAGGALQPLSMSILLETFPPKQHGMAMAIFGMGIMCGPIAGPILGGWITDTWSWRWIFYINVPIGIISILLTLMVISDPPYMKRVRMKIDYWGLMFLAVGLGSLQFVLDKGHREDWFSSPTIVTFSILAVAGLILLVIFEIYSKNPVVNFRLLRDRSYALGNLVLFFAFMSFFATIILLPIYLQTLMGYTSFLAGIILGPGAIATLLIMPTVGKLVTRVNPKLIVTVGLLTNATGIYLMSSFNLQSDFWSLVWPRVVLGAGMGCIFIPLSVMTISHIPKERMTEATALFNLLRNVGGSVGVAFITTMQARRAQFHQFRLVEHLTPFDTAYQMAKGKMSALLSFRGIENINPDMLIHGELMRQANMLAFNDTFFLLSLLTLSVLFLLFLLKRREPVSQEPQAIH